MDKKNKVWLRLYDSFSYITWRVIVTNSDSYAASTGHQVMFGEDLRQHKNLINRTDYYIYTTYRWFLVKSGMFLTKQLFSCFKINVFIYEKYLKNYKFFVTG